MFSGAITIMFYAQDENLWEELAHPHKSMHKYLNLWEELAHPHKSMHKYLNVLLQVCA
jgi:hypothetical protein